MPFPNQLVLVIEHTFYIEATAPFTEPHPTPFPNQLVLVVEHTF